MLDSDKAIFAFGMFISLIIFHLAYFLSLLLENIESNKKPLSLLNKYKEVKNKC